jgi:hypothetical protein
MVDVWSCPDCRATYRMPRHWEAAVFLAARRAAQTIHAARHGRSPMYRGRQRASDARPASELPAEWADPDWADEPPRERRTRGVRVALDDQLDDQSGE